MVSLLALTAAPLDTAPRPVLAIAFVNAFCTELLAPAAAAVPVAPLAPATLAEAPLPVLAPKLEPVLALPAEAAAARPPLPLPPMAVVEVPPPAVGKLEVCVPVAAPPDVLT